MKVFSEKFDMEKDTMNKYLDFTKPPKEEEVYHYVRYVTVSCKMENEIPIICLVYIERLLTKVGILLTNETWKRLILISLCMASKIWDDDSLENVHFPKVMSDVTLRTIMKLEKAFLDLLNYDLVVKGGEYAKYYFILRTLASEIDTDLKPKQISKRSKKDWGEFPIKDPIKAEKMVEIQRNTAKAEVLLKEYYEKEKKFDITI